MKEISLNASEWRDRDAFYNALLPALGAPSWHGRNLDALNDSISSGDIFAIRLPIRIEITNSAAVPSELRDYLAKFADLITDLKTRRACDIALVLDSLGKPARL